MAARDRKVAITCTEFEAQIHQLIRDGVDIEDIMVHPHAQKCLLCRELLRELKLIAAEAERGLGRRYLN